MKRPRLNAPADHNPTTASASSGEGELRLLTKREVCARVKRSPATIWQWMRLGVFPRSRNLRGKPVWLEHEITEFLRALPLVKLKGDDEGAR
jgi:predicted DNA-binding transcriptional regulator AlpA